MLATVEQHERNRNIPTGAHGEAILADIQEHVFVPWFPVPARRLRVQGPKEAFTCADLSIISRETPLAGDIAAEHLCGKRTEFQVHRR